MGTLEVFLSILYPYLFLKCFISLSTKQWATTRVLFAIFLPTHIIVVRDRNIEIIRKTFTRMNTTSYALDVPVCVAPNCKIWGKKENVLFGHCFLIREKSIVNSWNISYYDVYAVMFAPKKGVVLCFSYSGQLSTPFGDCSINSQLIVIFTSDSSQNHRGFLATYYIGFMYSFIYWVF